MDTVEYQAFGTSLDWFEEFHNIYSFAIEALPPCSNRWCTSNTSAVIKEAYLNAKTAYRYLQLVVTATSIQYNNRKDGKFQWDSDHNNVSFSNPDFQLEQRLVTAAMTCFGLCLVLFWFKKCFKFRSQRQTQQNQEKEVKICHYNYENNNSFFETEEKERKGTTNTMFANY
jgi:hypothetical protein